MQTSSNGLQPVDAGNNVSGPQLLQQLDTGRPLRVETVQPQFGTIETATQLPMEANTNLTGWLIGGLIILVILGVILWKAIKNQMAKPTSQSDTLPVSDSPNISEPQAVLATPEVIAAAVAMPSLVPKSKVTKKKHRSAAKRKKKK